VANEAHVDLVKRLYHAFGSNDLDRLLSLLSDDIIFEFPKMPSVPLREKYVGKAGVRQFFADRAPAIHYTSFEPQTFLSDSDAVIVLGETAGTVIPTRVPFQYKWVQFFEIAADQRISRFYEFLDTQAFCSAFAPRA
jgi:ketosteroid isomerase-like protein